MFEEIVKKVAAATSAKVTFAVDEKTGTATYVVTKPIDGKEFAATVLVLRHTQSRNTVDQIAGEVIAQAAHSFAVKRKSVTVTLPPVKPAAPAPAKVATK